jgi:hypothetical protein
MPLIMNIKSMRWGLREEATMVAEEVSRRTD